MRNKKKTSEPSEREKALIQYGRNQVLYLLLVLGDENVVHDDWHPDIAQVLVDARKQIVSRLKVQNTWPTRWPDFETYSCRPG